MIKIKQIPIFGYFDKYKNYDGHKIEPLNKYIIKLISNNKETNFLFNYNECRCYGILLLNLPSSVEYEIKYFIKPHKIIDVNYERIINELYNLKIEDNDEIIDKNFKKLIINIITGLLEKNITEKV